MKLNLCLEWWKAMVAALGNSKDYTLKQYLIFANKLQEKAKVSQLLSGLCYIKNYLMIPSI